MDNSVLEHYTLVHYDARAGGSVAKKTLAEAGWRGSADLWLKGAYEILVQSGIGAVQITTLATRLKLARTSFYWSFKDREELLAALIEDWGTKNTGNFIRKTEDYAETIVEAYLNVCDCWHDPSLFDFGYEFAIRSWAQQSADVAAKLRAADTRRLQALTRMFTRFSYGEESAEVRARAFYLCQIGYISMKTKEDLATRMERISAYAEIFIGKAPGARDLDRFFGRHNYVPAGAVSAANSQK